MDVLSKHVIHTGHEWAVIILDETGGGFYCQSSFGTYCHIWANRGRGVTLRQFLRGVRFSYFMGKTRPGYEKFDLEKSVRDIKNDLKRFRKEGECDWQELRAAWDEINDIAEYADSQNSTLFVESLYGADALTKVVGTDELYVYARTSPDGDSMRFWERIWPEFLKKIEPRQSFWKRWRAAA